jgi:hypothetical protein
MGQNTNQGEHRPGDPAPPNDSCLAAVISTAKRPCYPSCRYMRHSHDHQKEHYFHSKQYTSPLDPPSITNRLESHPLRVLHLLGPGQPVPAVPVGRTGPRAELAITDLEKFLHVERLDGAENLIRVPHRLGLEGRAQVGRLGPLRSLEISLLVRIVRVRVSGGSARRQHHHT